MPPTRTSASVSATGLVDSPTRERLVGESTRWVVRCDHTPSSSSTRRDDSTASVAASASAAAAARAAARAAAASFAAVAFATRAALAATSSSARACAAALDLASHCFAAAPRASCTCASAAFLGERPFCELIPLGGGAGALFAARMRLGGGAAAGDAGSGGCAMSKSDASAWLDCGGSERGSVESSGAEVPSARGAGAPAP